MPKGQTFLSEEEQTRNGKCHRHLRIVITENDDNNEFLVVSVTSWYDGARWQDSNCILYPGDHPFIIKKSWVDFKRSRSMSYAEVFNGLNHGLLIRKEDISSEILHRIQCAAYESEFIQDELRRFFDYF